MFFFVAAIIVAAAGSAVTIKTLVGYNQLSLWFKFLVAGVVVAGWTAPMLTHLLRRAYGFLAAPIRICTICFIFCLALPLFFLFYWLSAIFCGLPDGI